MLIIKNKVIITLNMSNKACTSKNNSNNKLSFNNQAYI